MVGPRARGSGARLGLRNRAGRDRLPAGADARGRRRRRAVLARAARDEERHDTRGDRDPRWRALRGGVGGG